MPREPRRHGTWSKVHESIDDHPKTHAAAAVLVDELGIPEDYARCVVVRAVRRLVCWAIRESDDGCTERLSDFALAAHAWPSSVAPGGPLFGHANPGVLRRALRAVPDGHDRGFLWLWGARQGRPGVEHLHEFHFYAWDVLKGRPHYRGTSVGDYVDGPRGRQGSGAPAARPGAIGAPGGLFPVERSAPLSVAPSRPAAAPSVRPRANPAPLANDGDGSPGRGSSEVGEKSAPMLGRNPLPDLDDRSREARVSPVLSIRQRDPDTEQIRPEGLNPPATLKLGAGWAGIPAGVRGGDPAAVAVWLRLLGPMSHAGLYAGATYVARFREHAGVVPPDVASDPSISPGRALEALVPAAWEALLSDLSGHLPTKDFPRKYSARSLASRWDVALGLAADEAASRRARFRRDRGA